MHRFELNDDERLSLFEQFTYAFETYEEDKIANICALLDNTYDESPGTYLSWLRHLLAQRAFVWDMSSISHTRLTSVDIEYSNQWSTGAMPYVLAE